MSEYGSNYVDVDANAVMLLTNEGGSGNGGYSVTGYYINWSTNGITGVNWTEAIAFDNSPFAGYTPEELQGIITDEGNLDRIFREWGNSHTDEQELGFLLQMVQRYGSNRDGGTGCIGEQMYE